MSTPADGLAIQLVPAAAPGGCNVWVVGNDDGLLVVDAGRDAGRVAAAVNHRRVHAIVCTHGDEDHIAAAVELSGQVTAPIYIGQGDRPAWDRVHPHRPPYDELRAGDIFRIARHDLHVVPHDGHTPGGCALHVADLGLLFCGDVLPGHGGPLQQVPSDTRAYPAHGHVTTLAALLDIGSSVTTALTAPDSAPPTNWGERR